MKALSLTQPWATLVAIGAKTLETRGWSTNYRGTIAIHAAKGFPREAIELCLSEPFRTALRDAGILRPGDLPRGGIIAIAGLVDVVPTTDLFIAGRLEASTYERQFGDYSDGRYAFVLSAVRALPHPIECRGALSIWDVPADIERSIQQCFGAAEWRAELAGGRR